jgi:hypothetical protein
MIVFPIKYMLYTYNIRKTDKIRRKSKKKKNQDESDQCDGKIIEKKTLIWKNKRKGKQHIANIWSHFQLEMRVF